MIALKSLPEKKNISFSQFCWFPSRKTSFRKSSISCACLCCAVPARIGPWTVPGAHYRLLTVPVIIAMYHSPSTQHHSFFRNLPLYSFVTRSLKDLSCASDIEKPNIDPESLLFHSSEITVGLPAFSTTDALSAQCILAKTRGFTNKAEAIMESFLHRVNSDSARPIVVRLP